MLTLKLLVLFLLLSPTFAESEESEEASDVEVLPPLKKGSGKMGKFTGTEFEDDEELPPQYIATIYNGFRYWCMGVLISDFWTLTVAHCIYNRDPKMIFVSFGRYYKDQIHGDYDGSSARYVIPHPRFKIDEGNVLDSKSKHNRYDIGLIQTRKGFFDIPKARLQFPWRNGPERTDKFIAYGWGLPGNWQFDQDKINGPFRQMYPYMKPTLHKLKYLRRGTVSENAEPYVLGFDKIWDDRAPVACHGDSGAPLISAANSTQAVYGLASSASACTMEWPKTTKSVFTRIAVFWDWIRPYVPDAQEGGFLGEFNHPNNMDTRDFL